MSKSKFAEYEAEIEQAAVATRCLICNWLERAEKDDAEFIRSLLALPASVKGHVHVSKVFAAGGVKVSPDVVQRHRRSHLGRG